MVSHIGVLKALIYMMDLCLATRLKGCYILPKQIGNNLAEFSVAMGRYVPDPPGRM